MFKNSVLKSSVLGGLNGPLLPGSLLKKVGGIGFPVVGFGLAAEGGKAQNHYFLEDVRFVGPWCPKPPTKTLGQQTTSGSF